MSAGAQVKRAIQSAHRALLIRLSRCAKACFLDGAGAGLSYEGGRLMADLASFARLDPDERQHALLRDGNLAIDPLSLARIEGRREVVWRLQRLIGVDEAALKKVVEGET